MFFDDSLKGLKKELKAAGADTAFVKSWQKSYDKVRKQSSNLENQYTKEKSNLKAVWDCLNNMEELLVSMNVGIVENDIKKELPQLSKDMKKYQGDFNLEFLISKEDKEFHLIYETILSLCGKDMTDKKNLLILHSEVENLMAITKEALEKQWPEFKAMAYFYLEHTDRELSKLPHQEKMELVKKTYQVEFYNPMLQVVEAALGSERANKIMEVELWI